MSSTAPTIKQAGGVLTSIPGRYAKALFNLAIEQGQAEEVAENLEAVQQLLMTSEPLKKIFSNPAFTKEEHRLLLQELLKKLKASSLMQNFFMYLVQHHRLKYLSAIVELYQRLVDEEKGIKLIKVISAFSLTSAQIKQITKLAKSLTAYVPKLSFSIDPKLMGGIVLRYDSQQIDASVVTQLNHLAISMKGPD